MMEVLKGVRSHGLDPHDQRLRFYVCQHTINSETRKRPYVMVLKGVRSHGLDPHDQRLRFYVCQHSETRKLLCERKSGSVGSLKQESNTSIAAAWISSHGKDG